VTVSTQLAEWRAQDIHVWVDGDQLRCNAPPGKLTPELRDQLRQHKSEILEFLRGPTELSFAQQRLWLIDQIEPGGAAYIIAGALELRGVLDTSALERALAAIVDRHDALRTVFVSVQGEPRQVVLEPGHWALPVADLCGQSDATARLKTILRREATRGFDLVHGPLFRAQLYRLAADVHVLALVMHHIISDGWSLGVLTRELSELYGAFVRGTTPALPPLRIQYRDFARWQRGWLQGEMLEGQLAHWRSRLAGAPQVLELPADRARPALESHRGASHMFTMPRELLRRLHGLSQRDGATLFMTLVSGFALLLARYSGQRNLLIGTPVANRNRAEIEPLIGFFVNTLVLHADLSGEPSVREFLRRMREVCLDAYAHQNLPFERLVEELQPSRDLSRNPLFQVMFILQNAPAEALELPGLTLKPLELGTATAQVDLTLTVREMPNGLIGEFRYAVDLFDASTIERMAGHWRVLLEAMVETPECRIENLPLISETERRLLLEDWNDTGSDYPRERCVHELFEENATQIPDRVAVVFRDESMSYGVLEDRANRLATELRVRGIGSGQRVGLCLDRGTDMLVTMLAILKVGAAYVPLDPTFPRERLRYMAHDADLAILIATTNLASAFEMSHERQLLLDSDYGSLVPGSSRSQTIGAVRPKPEDPAYVIYTSGSTGQPKGVVVPHRAVVNFLVSMAKTPGLTAKDVLVSVTTFSFDISVLELLLPLAVGGRVVIVDRDEAADGYALCELLRRHHASAMQATPTTWRILLEAGWRGRAGLKALVGGEPLPKDLAQTLIACGAELWNMYGPTETTVWSTCARITDATNGISIGKPIANTTVRILDSQRNLCPIGVPGEMCIGGDGPSLGYWKRPELTAERFISDPFSSVPGGRLYRTGDLARWRDNGVLEHLGRLDNQIKLRGHRIELGEIEATLGRHPAVRRVVVDVRDDRQGDKRLVAYLQTDDAPADLIERLRAQLRRFLPEYMIPAHFVQLDELPLTPNGKVDRKALPGVALESRRGASYVPPQTEYECALASIWCQVLGVDQVSVRDNFFDIGGHSLLAIRSIAMFKEQTGRSLSPRDYYQQTLAQLAASVDEAVAPIRDTSPESSIALEPFFFGSDARRKFGLLRLPPSSRDAGIVLCQPHAHEYIRCHRAFRELGQRLAQAGFDVLSFDYYGTGDSDGEYDEARICDWTTDASQAIDALKQRQNVSRVYLLGLRLGASLAMMAAAGRTDISGIALWDPIVLGSELEADLAHIRNMQALDPARQRDIEHPDVLSYPLTPRLMEDIGKLDLRMVQLRGVDWLLVVETETQRNGCCLIDRATAFGARAEYRFIDDARIWVREPYEAIVPQKSLSALVSWVSETSE